MFHTDLKQNVLSATAYRIEDWELHGEDAAA